MYADKLFWQSLRVTSIYTFVSVPLGLILAFLMALLMNTKNKGDRVISHGSIIYPVLCLQLLMQCCGPGYWTLISAYSMRLYIILESLKFPGCNNQNGPYRLWSWWVFGVGSSMIIFLAGLQGIDEVYYEAAKIDGAGRWAQMRHITIPWCRRVIFFNSSWELLDHSKSLLQVTWSRVAALKIHLVLCAISLPARIYLLENGIRRSFILGPFLYYCDIYRDRIRTLGRRVYYQE